jgi:hypothetical protein
VEEALQLGDYLVTFERPDGGEPAVHFRHLAEVLTIPGRMLAEMTPPAGQPATIGRDGDGQSVSLTAEELAALRQVYREWRGGLPVLGAEDVALITDAEIVLADGSIVPIVKDHLPDGRPFQWADERQWCRRVHQALDERLDEIASLKLRVGCSCWEKWPDGRMGCTLTSGPRSGTYAPCLFEEPRNSQGWAKARRWVSVTVDGEDCLTLTKE